MKLGGIIYFLLFSCQAFSQTISGNVTDTLGNPIRGASILLLETTQEDILSYSSTDNSGKYSIINSSNIPISNLRLEVRALGFKSESVQLTKDNTRYDFKLANSVIQLPDIVVHDNRPQLQIQGDTTSYAVSDFAHVNDRVIGDVLQRMPGIEVANDGRISYNGKPISRFYIEGDNLLDDKYNIASNTIPNAIVDKVQVIENDEPIKINRKLSTSTATAINITLKEDAKRKPVNQIEMGVGTPGIFDGEVDNLVFYKNYKAINQFQLNNIGIDLREELKSHDLAALRSKIGYTPLTAMLSIPNTNPPQINTERSSFNNSGLLNTNNLFKLKDDVEFNLKLNYLYDKLRQNFYSFNEMYLLDDTVSYFEQLDNINRPKSLGAEVEINVNKENYYLNNSFRLGLNEDLSTATLSTFDNSQSQRLKSTYQNFENEFSIAKVKDRVVLDYFFYITSDRSPQNLTISPFQAPGVLQFPDPISKVIQEVYIPSLYLNNSIGIKTGKRLIQHYKFGMSWQNQKLNSDLNAYSLSQSLITNDIKNRLNWNRYNLYAQGYFTFKSNDEKLKASFAIPLSFQKTKLSDEVGSREITNFLFTPHLNIAFDMGRENILNANFMLMNRPSELTDTYRGYILKNYRTLQAHDGLNQTKNEIYSLGYTFRKSINLFFLNANVSYINQNMLATLASNVTDNFSISNSLQNPINNLRSILISTKVSKYLFNIKSTINGGYSWQGSESNQYLNGDLIPYQLYFNTFQASLDSKIHDDLFVKYSGIYSTSISQAAGRKLNKGQSVQRIRQELELTWSPASNIYFMSGIEHFYNPVPSVDISNRYFIDTSVRYRWKRLRSDVSLSVSNIANEKAYSMSFLSSNSFYTNSYPLRGRLAMFKIQFTL